MTRGRPRSEISPCRFCSKQFKRLEHLRRHERTHTQEKPFVCECGRSFSRQDLLSRHERISHPSGQKANPLELATASSDIVPPQGTGTGWVTPDHQNNTPSSTNICDASSANVSSQIDLDLGIFQDPDLFWDADSFSFDTLAPVQFLDTDISLCDLFNQFPTEKQQDQSSLPLSQEFQYNTQPRSNEDVSTSQDAQNSSLYPSLPPQFPAISDRLQENDLDTRADITESPWAISAESYKKILDKMIQLKSILPEFVPLSICALVRYLEGYFKGFHDHLPFLHPVTFCPEKVEIELLLSLAAAGALYRFEHKQGYVLYEAVRCLIDERSRSQRRAVVEQISSQTKRTSISDCSGSEKASDDHNGHNPESRDANLSIRLQRTQALIVLMAMSLWGKERLLPDSFIIGSQLAQIVRELGINQSDYVSRADLDWLVWVNHEQRRRTLLVAYIILNLQSIAFDVPPMILSQEVALGLPSCESVWKVSSPASWKTHRVACGYEYAFGAALDRLLRGQRVCEEGMVSAFSNYILIHGLVQKIYLQQKASASYSPDSSTSQTPPPPDHIRSMERALKAWQSSWETTRESTLDPCSPKGPLGFNATALLRLAHIRLNVRSGRCSTLLAVTTKTPTTQIQDIFADARLPNSNPDSLTRSPSLDRAVFQCIHALSIPIRVGISYVARIQTIHWSIQHSICNLECAYLLTRWMQKIAAVIRAEGVLSLREDEQRLLSMVNGLVQDTHTQLERTRTQSVSLPSSHRNQGGSAQAMHVERLAVLAIRLWAEVTSGLHVFDIVHRAGAALSRIADVLESQL